MAKRRSVELGQVEQHVFPNLLADVVFEIFSRLPTKLLMRCKSVCKSWSSFISSPFFVTAYKNKLKILNHDTTNLFFTTTTVTTRNQSLLYSTQLYHDKYGIIKTRPSIQLPSPPYRVEFPFSSCCLAVSAGVVCHYIVSNRYQPHESWKRVRVVPVRILNLLTGEFATFPIQLRLYPNVALGFSPVTNEYKVVTAVKGFKFKVFTLGGKSNTWKDVADVGFEDLGVNPALLNFSVHYLCLHGAIHWMQPIHRENQAILLAFDIVEERFRVIPLPFQNNGKYRMIEVNGCVAVFILEVGGDDTEMDFWILKDYKNEVWLKEKIMFPVRWWGLGYPLPVCSIHTGEILLSPSPRQREYGWVHLYDMKLKTYKKTDIVLPEGSVIVTGGYEETLSPLN